MKAYFPASCIKEFRTWQRQTILFKRYKSSLPHGGQAVRFIHCSPIEVYWLCGTNLFLQTLLENLVYCT